MTVNNVNDDRELGEFTEIAARLNRLRRIIESTAGTDRDAIRAAFLGVQDAAIAVLVQHAIDHHTVDRPVTGPGSGNVGSTVDQVVGRVPGPHVDFGSRWTSAETPGVFWRLSWDTGTGGLAAVAINSPFAHETRDYGHYPTPAAVADAIGDWAYLCLQPGGLDTLTHRLHPTSLAPYWTAPQAVSGPELGL